MKLMKWLPLVFFVFAGVCAPLAFVFWYVGQLPSMGMNCGEGFPFNLGCPFSGWGGTSWYWGSTLAMLFGFLAALFLGLGFAVIAGIAEASASQEGQEEDSQTTDAAIQPLGWCRTCGAENTSKSIRCEACHRDIESRTLQHHYTTVSPARGIQIGGPKNKSFAPARTRSQVKYLDYRVKNDDQLESTRASIERNFIWGRIRLEKGYYEAWVDGVAQGRGTEAEVQKILDDARDGKRPQTKFTYYQIPSK